MCVGTLDKSEPDDAPLADQCALKAEEILAERFRRDNCLWCGRGESGHVVLWDEGLPLRCRSDLEEDPAVGRARARRALLGWLS